MAGLSYLNATDWRYENAGTADLLSVSGTTLENLDKTQSRTGTAFYQTTQVKCFDLPTTGEIWLKFDVYFNGSTRWWACDAGTSGKCGIISYSSSELDFVSNGSFVDESHKPLKANALQTVLLHMISGASAGVIEAWVDGEKIYTYTGDVNRGQDFSDIYLQSDGSGTFFSNVTISNSKLGVTAFDCAIKPEIYISWIPTGQVGLRPQIFATYIPAPLHEKISADLSRNVGNPESTSGDLNRQVGSGEEISADVSRHVVSTEIANVDTARKISVAENISGDTRRHVVEAGEAHADTYLHVTNSEKIIGDTARKLGITTIRADLQRFVNATTRIDGDTCRRAGVAEKILADLDLKITSAETAAADTFRKVEDSVPTVAKADTRRTIGVREKISADTSRVFGQRETASADTLLQTAAQEKISADLLRGLREFVRADTSRKVTRAEKALASTVIRVPHVLNYVVESKPQTLKAAPKLKAAGNSPFSLVNTFKNYGVTAVNITLSEKTLSDTFTFDIASRSMDINEAVQGWLLDYPFSFFVEETTQTDIVQTVKGRYNVDDLLYKWFHLATARIEINGKEIVVPGGRIEKGRNDSYVFIYPTAFEIVTKIAHYFGMVPVVMLLNDFTPSNLSGDQALTYADLLNSVFSWTSRLPHIQVNVFIRGGTMYCVQRGREPNVFDITNLPHSRPTITKKFNRVLCYNPNNSGNGNEDDDDSNNDDDDRKLFSGVIEYSNLNFDLRYEYVNGFLQQEYQHMDTGGSTGIAGISHPISTVGEWTSSTATTSTTYTYVTYDDLTKTAGDRAEAKTEVQKEELFERYVATKSTQNTTTQATGESTLTEHQINEATKVYTALTTTYHYARTYNSESDTPEIYLVAEYETTQTVEYEYNPNSNHVAQWEKVSDEYHVKKTFHAPIGNGWYGQVVYLDGAFQGANLSQGKPGNRVSPYTVSKFAGSRVDIVEEDETVATNPLGELSYIVDDSFPVRDAGLKYALNSALRWLHRKIEETVTVDLTSRIVDGVPDIAHIVDFTDRIILDGASYFLVSNKISFTPRKLIQKLTLIRWY